jgi:hypothetical protein
VRQVAVSPQGVDHGPDALVPQACAPPREQRAPPRRARQAAGPMRAWGSFDGGRCAPAYLPVGEIVFPAGSFLATNSARAQAPPPHRRKHLLHRVLAVLGRNARKKRRPALPPKPSTRQRGAAVHAGVHACYIWTDPRKGPWNRRDPVDFGVGPL